MTLSDKLKRKNYELKTKDRLVAILLGPPGAGKGTQAILLADKLGLYYFETSKIIEENIKEAKEGDFVEVEGKKFPLLKEKENWEKGDISSPPLVVFWIKNKIERLATLGENLVMAGSPRSLYEGKELLPLFKKLYGPENIKVILMELSVKESIFRNSHRRICALMRHPILYNEETKNLKNCPLDGSKLMKRALDKPEIIEKRFRVYQKKTLPLVDFFEKEGLKVKKVNGEQSVAKVFKDILEVLCPR